MTAGDDGMKIRQISTDDERRLVSVPIQAYGFQPSPAPEGMLDRLRGNQRYYEEHVTLVAELDGVAVADASAVPMRQNVRGAVYEMAGVAGVATLPQARRRGYARALVTEILGVMRDRGYVVSALYPFRPSFYGRFGYVGLPMTRTVTFSPSSVAGLLRMDLAGTVRWGPVADHYAPYRDFIGRLLSERHGFALLPESRMAQLREAGDRWLATAWVGDVVAAAVTYRIDGFAGDLVADDLLIASPLGRALLLQFFATHTDQVARITATTRRTTAAALHPNPGTTPPTATARASPRAAGQVASPPPHCRPGARNPAAPAPPGPHRAGQPAGFGPCAPRSPDRRHEWSPPRGPASQNGPTPFHPRAGHGDRRPAGHCGMPLPQDWPAPSDHRHCRAQAASGGRYYPAAPTAGQVHRARPPGSPPGQLQMRRAAERHRPARQSGWTDPRPTPTTRNGPDGQSAPADSLQRMPPRSLTFPPHPHRPVPPDHAQTRAATGAIAPATGPALGQPAATGRAGQLPTGQ